MSTEMALFRSRGRAWSIWNIKDKLLVLYTIKARVYWDFDVTIKHKKNLKNSYPLTEGLLALGAINVYSFSSGNKFQ